MSFNGDLYPTAGADVVMTTSGDMVKYESGARARLGIGSANQNLQVKSSLPSWETLSTAGSVLTTQGDILYENASGLARLGFGTSGDVLTTKGTGADPVWATAGGGQVETIANYETSAATENHTFTFSPTIDLDLYQYLYITVAGTTNHGGTVELLWNGLTSAYDYDFSDDDNGTWSFTEAASQVSAVICPATLNSSAKGIIARIWLIPTESNSPTEYYQVSGTLDINGEGRSLFHAFRAPSDINTLSDFTISVVNPSYTPMGFLPHTRMRISGCLK